MFVSAIHQPRISHRSTNIPSLLNFPPTSQSHPSLLDCHRTPGRAPYVIQQLTISYINIVMYMFQCYSLISSHPILLPLYPRVCCLCLSLYSCPANRFISTIFLDSIYICLNIRYLFFSFWLISFCMASSSFIHITRTDSNVFLFMAE